MSSSYDKEKILQCMFNPEISEILAELENGGKDSAYLSEKFQISENEIHDRLSYLIEHAFVDEEKTDDKVIFTADGEKLTKLLENEKNFDGVVDGLTEMDSYLN
jgi:transcription initiation factor IIE alpha subunit